LRGEGGKSAVVFIRQATVSGDFQQFHWVFRCSCCGEMKAINDRLESAFFEVQTDSWTDRQTVERTNRQGNRQRNRRMNGQTCLWTEKQTNSPTKHGLTSNLFSWDNAVKKFNHYAFIFQFLIHLSWGKMIGNRENIATPVQ